MSCEAPARTRDAPAPDALKRAFSLFPSGVVIVATRDARGVAHGFTASTFVPLSLDPPMVLVCLNRSAQCHAAFAGATGFAVSVLRPEHRQLALRFATRGADKFAGAQFERGDAEHPLVPEAIAQFECKAAAVHPGGDHVILTGVVERVRHGEHGAAMVHFARTFHAVAV
jgi:flavin reductase ActVB